MLNRLSNTLREPMNGLTHLAGAILAALGTALMIYKTCMPLDPWRLITFSVFGASMTAMYLASSFYHLLKVDEKWIALMRRIDHIMIFIFIASTYTPICLVSIKGGWGWSLFGVVWGIALSGFFIKVFWMNAPRWLSTLIYISMGWLCVVAAYPIIKAIQTEGLVWLAIGGIAHTIGAVIYALKKPNPLPRILGFHEIFHLFVMAGTFSHFMVIYKYV